MFAVGSKLGLYEILSALGTGGMDEVYCARDTRHSTCSPEEHSSNARRSLVSALHYGHHFRRLYPVRANQRELLSSGQGLLG